VLASLGVERAPVVGMSLGGLVALGVASAAPALVDRLGMIGRHAGSDAREVEPHHRVRERARSFASLDELVARTMAHNPTRSESSLRRGVLHNALQLDDGTWVWRHQRFDAPTSAQALDSAPLWDELSASAAPVLLVRAMGPGSVLDDQDEAEFRRRQPSARVVHVTDSGHSVQATSRSSSRACSPTSSTPSSGGARRLTPAVSAPLQGERHVLRIRAPSELRVGRGVARNRLAMVVGAGLRALDLIEVGAKLLDETCSLQISVVDHAISIAYWVRIDT